MNLTGKRTFVGHLLFGSFLVLIMITGTDLYAQEKTKPAENAELEDIIKLRDEMGSIGTILKGVNSVNGKPLGDSLEQEFKNELNRLYNPNVAAPPATEPNVPAIGPVQPNRSVGQMLTKPFPNQRAKLVLRNVARELEALSWDLEDVEQYENADQIRELATRLRLQSRVSPGAINPNSNTDSPSLVR